MAEVVNITQEEPENDNFNTSLGSIYKLAGIYLACSVTAALVIAVFVDPLTRWNIIVSSPLELELFRENRDLSWVNLYFVII